MISPMIMTCLTVLIACLVLGLFFFLIGPWLYKDSKD